MIAAALRFRRARRGARSARAATWCQLRRPRRRGVGRLACEPDADRLAPVRRRPGVGRRRAAPAPTPSCSAGRAPACRQLSATTTRARAGVDAIDPRQLDSSVRRLPRRPAMVGDRRQRSVALHRRSAASNVDPTGIAVYDARDARRRSSRSLLTAQAEVDGVTRANLYAEGIDFGNAARLRHATTDHTDAGGRRAGPSWWSSRTTRDGRQRHHLAIKGCAAGADWSYARRRQRLDDDRARRARDHRRHRRASRCDGEPRSRCSIPAADRRRPTDDGHRVSGIGVSAASSSARGRRADLGSAPGRRRSSPTWSIADRRSPRLDDLIYSAPSLNKVVRALRRRHRRRGRRPATRRDFGDADRGRPTARRRRRRRAASSARRARDPDGVANGGSVYVYRFHADADAGFDARR